MTLSDRLSTIGSPAPTGPGTAVRDKIGLTVNVWAGKQILRSDFEEMRLFLDEAAAAGFGHAELGARGLGVVIGGKVQRSRIAALQEALESIPLRLSLHSSWFSSGRTGNLLDVGSTARQHQGLLCDVDVAAAIGAEVLVYHAGVLPNLYGDGDALAAAMASERDMIRALADDAGERGVMIAVENRAPTSAVLTRRSYGMRLDTVAEQVAKIDHPHVCVCLDVGHAYLAAGYLGYDYLEAVRAVAPLVGHVHFHDNFGKMSQQADADAYEQELLGEGDLHLPPGWGTIPLADVLAVPYPRDPAIILEMRHARHYAEALETTRGMLAARAS